MAGISLLFLVPGGNSKTLSEGEPRGRFTITLKRMKKTRWLTRK
jgi:hypothetical protein